MSRQGKRRARAQRRRRRLYRRLALAFFALLMAASLAYIAHYELTRRSILRGNEAFSALYVPPEIAPEATEAFHATPSPTPTTAPLPTATPSPTSAPTEAPTAAPAPTPAPTDAPTGTPEPTPAPSATPAPTFAAAIDLTLEPSATPEHTPEPTGTEAASERPSPTPDATPTTAAPLATADADTLVVALETPPPVQQSFAELLEANPETVGFLTIEDVLMLPVVQRPYDNDYYLGHSFDLAESIGGTLFLDGANLLAPEDDCLIVYGHNMRNGTMFQPLVGYEDLDFLRAHPLVRFDTLYQNRLWAPFAALTVTADPDSERYLDIRQFSFDDLGFDLFVRSLRALSAWDSPVEVAYGDELLLLVTCEYTHDNGRFVLALRAAREYESEYQLRALIQGAH